MGRRMDDADSTRGAQNQEGTARPVAAVESAALLRGRRELAIRHGADTYRLRLTASNKLILTK